MTREKASTIFERFQFLMEDEMGPGKFIAYGIAGTGLFAALYRIRPFARFRKPSDVPSHFLQTRVPLQGTVMHVEPSNGVLLMVDHQSLLPLPHFNNKSYLPVKICGVNVTSNGINWLQFMVSGNRITFVPVAKEKEYLECLVFLRQKDQDRIKIGEELVKLGLGTIHDPWTTVNDKHILTYKKSLINAQKFAIRQRNGYWHFIKQATLLWNMQMFIINKMKSLLPVFIVKHFNF